MMSVTNSYTKTVVDGEKCEGDFREDKQTRLNKCAGDEAGERGLGGEDGGRAVGKVYATLEGVGLHSTRRVDCHIFMKNCDILVR